MRRHLVQCRPIASASVAALLALITACTAPPPTAYVKGGGADPTKQVALGKNAVGEACSMQDGEAGGSDVYCGAWQQPSARLRPGQAATPADLPALAADSPWRESIDQRFVCQPPVATFILGTKPAELLQCTQRVGGWPHVAMITVIGGRAWYADGVLPAATATERAIGVRAGVITAAEAPASSAADALLAQRLAAQSVSSGDIGAFNGLIAAGTRANLSDNPSAAEAAFRAALALQRKVLGRDNPNTAGVVMTLALELSDEGRYTEAADLFTEAGALVPRAADPILQARLLHYRGLDALNRHEPEAALTLLHSADAAYAALVPPSLQSPPVAAPHSARASMVTNQNMLSDPQSQDALIGMIEVRREQAVALRELGRPQEAATLLNAVTHLAEANGLARPALAARLYRTRGAIAAQSGNAGLAMDDLQTSLRDFSRAMPESKPLADTALLQASQLAHAGRLGEVVPVCRSAIDALVTLKASTTPGLIAPCLDAYGAAAAAATGAPRQALLAEMFTAAQLGQGGITSEQIAQATARLQESARDPKVADAIRRRQDLADKLQHLYRSRDELLAGGGKVDTADIDKQIRQVQADQADADAALQAASPSFGQLAQQVVKTADVFALLRPDEALVVTTQGVDDGWAMALRNGSITAARIAVGQSAMADLVSRLRASIELTNTLPTFDIAIAQRIYQLVLAPVAPALDGVKTLVVAPSGPLLSIPFEVLLTGPTDQQHLAEAPWLLRRYVISHVPAAANFVSLRKVAGGSRGGTPWFGFGDFQPVTLAQAEGSFSGACADSARLLAGLPRLPYAQKELAAARALLGASPNDELLGPAFTVPAVMKAKLKDVRVLHFAAHALLPAELRCQSEPAIVTSDPPGALNASQALLTASDVTQLDLDAELVILSACNSGGGGNGSAGESLSGLARAFFYAGARALMVTHWSVSDQVAAYLVADTLAKMHASPGLNPAAALQSAQLDMLGQAGKGMPPEVAHPFFWAPFAVIGAGGGAPAMQQASRGAAPAL